MSLTTSQVAELDKIQNFEGKYPLQLWSLFMIEMWERFCFYGMRGMLTIFMVRELSLLDTQATTWVSVGLLHVSKRQCRDLLLPIPVQHS